MDDAPTIIGINRGQLGYLTDINPDEDMAEQLEPLLMGQCLIESRFLIQAEVFRAGKTISAGSALNDIVLFPGDIAQMIMRQLTDDIDAELNQELQKQRIIKETYQFMTHEVGQDLHRAEVA
ncbi:MAG: hypothetical protein EB012_12625 [Gammaproteobacteria bacterium]|nr:hypothetical protein [Gammaproteobacteria bacterium]